MFSMNLIRGHIPSRVWSFFFDSGLSPSGESRSGQVVMKKVVFIVIRRGTGRSGVSPGTGGGGGARGGDLRRPAAPAICRPRGSFPRSSSATWIPWMQESARRYEAKGCRIIRHPREKDETDTELALRRGLRGWRRRRSGSGGPWGTASTTPWPISRSSSREAERGIEVKLIDEWCEVFLVTRRTVLDGEAGQTVSLLPFAGRCRRGHADGFRISPDEGGHGGRAAPAGSATA